MHKPDPKVIRYTALGAIAIVAAIGVAAFHPVYQSWRDDDSIRHAHITYVRFPCAAMTPAGTCPAYTLDVYGDGTVIYQSASDTHVKGSYRYRIDDQETRDYMRDLFASTFWAKPVATGPTREGGACMMVMQMDKQVLKNGCLKWTPGTDQAMNDGSVSDTVAQLEAITHVNSLARGDANTQDLLRKAHIYKAPKPLLHFKSKTQTP